MTEKELQELGFYKDGTFIKQIYSRDFEQMDLDWFGIRCNDLKTLKADAFIRMVYDRAKAVGYKQGGDSIKQSIHDILKIDD